MKHAVSVGPGADTACGAANLRAARTITFVSTRDAGDTRASAHTQGVVVGDSRAYNAGCRPHGGRRNRLVDQPVAPVAQGIEHPFPKRVVARSNRAGGTCPHKSLAVSGSPKPLQMRGFFRFPFAGIVRPFVPACPPKCSPEVYLGVRRCGAGEPSDEPAHELRTSGSGVLLPHGGPRRGEGDPNSSRSCRRGFILPIDRGMGNLFPLHLE